MKKKILFFIILILISFITGILVHHFVSFLEKQEIEKKYLSIIGTIDKIYDNNTFYVIPNEQEIKNQYKTIHFSLTENSNTSLIVGDIIKIKYLPENINKNGKITSPLIEYLGKTRLFKSNIDTPVSNSTSVPGTAVFKQLKIYNNKLKLNSFTNKDDIYLKKIVSYDEYLKYKKDIPDIRDLTETDFINYYLIIFISIGPDYSYTFEKARPNGDYLDLRVFKHQAISQTENIPTHTGLSIILPNNTDYEVSQMQIVDASTVY